MQIGMVGIGRMGGNMSRRLMKAGHRCVVFSAHAKSRDALAKEGAVAADSLAALVKALGERPRAVWLMLPAGQVTDETVEVLAALLDADDIIVDGGNSFYKDDIRRAKKLAERRIRYVDCGTSGGVWGIERGYCMMIGGPKAMRLGFGRHIEGAETIDPSQRRNQRKVPRRKNTPRPSDMPDNRPVPIDSKALMTQSASPRRQARPADPCAMVIFGASGDLDGWAAEKTECPSYASGSDGPKAADELLARDDNRSWRPVGASPEQPGGKTRS